MQPVRGEHERALFRVELHCGVEELEEWPQGRRPVVGEPDLERQPVGAAEIAHDIEENRERAVLDLVDRLHAGLMNRVVERRHVVTDIEIQETGRRDRDAGRPRACSMPRPTFGESLTASPISPSELWPPRWPTSSPKCSQPVLATHCCTRRPRTAREIDWSGSSNSAGSTSAREKTCAGSLPRLSSTAGIPMTPRILMVTPGSAEAVVRWSISRWIGSKVRGKYLSDASQSVRTLSREVKRTDCRGGECSPYPLNRDARSTRHRSAST